MLMGVSGSGKSTVMHELVERLGWQSAEGDEFHPPSNIEKMRSGHALTDEDRRPWLRALADWIGERERLGQDATVTCSALRRAYREVLRDGHPSVWFVHLELSPDALVQRLAERRGHYMPAALLRSQLVTLEPLGPDEPGIAIDGDRPAAAIADQIVTRLRESRPTTTDPGRGQ